MGKLCINGGNKLRQGDFPKWTVSTQKDSEILSRVYDSGKWGINGEQNNKFRNSFAKYSGVKHCITVANGTVSIELILRGLGIGRGDEVIVTPYTFIASISALIYAGATPVFADIDKETYNLSPESAERAITPRTKAIMPVYVGGRPAELDKFTELCRKYNLYLIGDAAQAVGSEYAGKGVGTYGIATSISCQNSKNLTCGEGGIILTNDDKLYENISLILSMGKTADGRFAGVGLNDGMSEWQAGILNTQLESLPEQIDRRMENAAYLDSRLAQLDFVSTLKNDPLITRNSYHLYLLSLREDMLKGVSRGRFAEALRAEGIPLDIGYGPVYDFPCISGQYAVKCIGGDVNTSPDTPVADYMARHEGCWFYHSVLLGSRKDMDDIADGFIKVYENLDELK